MAFFLLLMLLCMVSLLFEALAPICKIRLYCEEREHACVAQAEEPEAGERPKQVLYTISLTGCTGKYMRFLLRLTRGFPFICRIRPVEQIAQLLREGEGSAAVCIPARIQAAIQAIQDQPGPACRGKAPPAEICPRIDFNLDAAPVNGVGGGAGYRFSLKHSGYACPAPLIIGIIHKLRAEVVRPFGPSEQVEKLLVDSPQLKAGIRQNGESLQLPAAKQAWLFLGCVTCDPLRLPAECPLDLLAPRFVSRHEDEKIIFPALWPVKNQLRIWRPCKQAEIAHHDFR